MNSPQTIQVIQIIDDDISDVEMNQNEVEQKNQKVRSAKKRKRNNQDIFDYLYGEAECTDSDDDEEDDENASDADSNGNLKDFVVDSDEDDESFMEEDSDEDCLDWLIDDSDETDLYNFTCSVKRKLVDAMSETLDDLFKPIAKKKKCLIKPNKQTDNSTDIKSIDSQQDIEETLSD